MGISAWLPSMFAGMTKLQNEPTKKYPRGIDEHTAQLFIETSNCLDCGRKLEADMRLGIGKCSCGNEFSYEFLNGEALSKR